MKKTSVIIITSLLIVYFVFTSGLVYALQPNKEICRLIIPFSWSLSGYETGLVGIATQNDIDCVRWLANESNQELEIACGSNTIYMCAGYIELITRTWEKYGRFDRFIQMMEYPKREHCYVFLTEWNIDHMKYITPYDVGLRRQNDIVIKELGNGYINLEVEVYNIDAPWERLRVQADLKEVYRKGKAVVYEK